jgi:hypothetical protein
MMLNSQSLTRTGLLVLAGLGVYLLPFVPGRAQAPVKQETTPSIDVEFQQLRRLAQTQAERAIKAAQKGLGGADAAKFEALQEDLQAQRAQLERQLRQLQEAIARLKEAARQAETAQSAPPAQAQPPGTEKPKKGAPNYPLVYGPGIGTGAPAASKGTVDQRLDQVERKLDAILWEVTNLRRDMAKPHGPPGMMPPGATTPPAPPAKTIAPANQFQRGPGSGSLVPVPVPPTPEAPATPPPAAAPRVAPGPQAPPAPSAPELPARR